MATNERVFFAQFEHLREGFEEVETGLRLYSLLRVNLYHPNLTSRCYHLIGS